MVTNAKISFFPIVKYYSYIQPLKESLSPIFKAGTTDEAVSFIIMKSTVNELF